MHYFSVYRCATFLLALVAIAFAPCRLSAQNLSVDSIDASEFPILKARAYAFGADKRPLRGLTARNFSVFEAEGAREIVSVEFPEADEFQPISSVLMVDVSGSMTMDNRINLAREAATEWIEQMALDVSECAVGAFEDNSYIFQDFTRSRDRLLAAVRSLKPLFGTHYDNAFLDAQTGAFSVARRGQYRRVVVFLTDGVGTGNQDSIIRAARADSITVYCIALGMKMPNALKAVAGETGGSWYENVRERAELLDIYRRILYKAQNSKPGVVAWRSVAACSTARFAKISLTAENVSTQANVRFDAPLISLARLEISPRSLLFRNVGAGNSQGQRVTVKAAYQPVTITAVELDNPRFSVSGSELPTTLQQGETATFVVGFRGEADSIPQLTRINFITDECAPMQIFARAAYGNKKFAALGGAMAITAPAQDNLFYSGADTVITWTGLTPSETVALDYSLDNGATWLPLTSKAKGLRYDWRVPPVSGAKLLTGSKRPMRVRARQIWDASEIQTEPSVLIEGHIGSLLTATFSKDGSRVLTSSSDRTAKIFDAYTGALLQSFEGHGGFVSSAAFSPDEKRVFTASYDNGLRVWDAETGALLVTVGGRGLRSFYMTQKKTTGSERLEFVNQGNERFLYVASSPDGQDIIAATDVGSVMRLKAASLRPQNQLTMVASGWIYSAEFSRNGQYILSAGGDFSARIWNASGNGLTNSVKKFVGHSDQVTFASFNPDETLVATGSMDNTARIWDVKSEAQIKKLQHKGTVWSARFSPDGSRLVTASMDGSVRIWSVKTGELLASLPAEMGGYHHAEFSPDGTRVVGAGVDGYGRIWDVGGGFMQEATSATFYVVAPQATALKEIDMGGAFLGSSKDVVARDALKNPDKSVVRVLEARFTGEHSDEFSLVSGIPPFDVPPGVSQALELRFQPKERGKRRATLEIITWTDTLRIAVRGEGEEQGFALAAPLSFGEAFLRRSRDTTITVLKNTGTTPLVVKNLALETMSGAGFQMLDARRTPFTLKPNDSARARIVFAPERAGVASAAVKIELSGFSGALLIPVSGRATPPALEASIAITAASDGVRANTLLPQESGEIFTDTLRLRQQRSTLVRPLLGYVFFDENSTDIPTRYCLLSREQAANFTEKTLPPLCQNETNAKAARVEGIDSYYHVLNILGERLRERSDLRARITGCNSDAGAERGATALSRARAERVARYFVEIFGIDEKRLRIVARNKPERPSNSADADGAAENRRVEIVFEGAEADAVAPVAADETIYLANASTLELSLKARADDTIQTWSVDCLALPLEFATARRRKNAVAGQIISSFSGEGAPPGEAKQSLGNAELARIAAFAKTSSPGKARQSLVALVLRLRVETVSGDVRYAETPALLLQLERLRAISTETAQTDSIPPHAEAARFALTFFDFDKTSLSEQNRQILNILKDRLSELGDEGGELTIVGYTDRVGEASYNKRLSAARADGVLGLLPASIARRATAYGLGESVLLYDNTFPEGRFYCRMVEILLLRAPHTDASAKP